MILTPKPNTSGLVRIVMINSGQADYVEIEPHSSVHLVGDNGIGKSMILSTIQFLLIDDWTKGKMKMSKGALKHKEFYFPNSKSYIIFELESTEGVHHLYVLRGLGKTNKFGIEKWAAEGCWYNENMFLETTAEGTRVRGWEEVRNSLLSEASNLEKVTGKVDRVRTLKAWLGWYGNSQSESEFSNLYLQFLKLGSIKEQALKHQIISSSVTGKMTKRIDISEDYSRTWREIVEEKANLENLREVEPELKQAIGQHNELTERKNNLTNRFVEISEPIQNWYNDSQSNLKSFEKNKKMLLVNISNCSNQEKQLNLKIGELRDSQNRLIYEVETEQKTEKFASNFDHENATKMESEFQIRHESIVAQLGSAKISSVSSLEKQLTKLNEEKYRLKLIIEGNSKTLYSSLKSVGIEDLEIINGFKILNEKMLYSEGRVLDKELVKQWFHKLSKATKNNIVSINGIEVSLSSDNFELHDIKSAKESLIDINSRITNISQLIKINRNNAPLVEEKIRLMTQIITLQNDLQRFSKWNESGKIYFLDIRAKYAAGVENNKQLQIQLSNIIEQKEEIRVNIENLNKQITEIDDVDSIMREYKECNELLSLDSIPHVSPLKDAVEFKLLVKRLRSDCNTYFRENQLFNVFLLKIQNRLGSTLGGISRDDFIDEAKQKLEGIEDLESHVQDLWSELSKNISGTAESLTKSLREVERKIHSINNVLKKKEITNLKEIHIGIDKNDTKVQSIIRAASTTMLHRFESRESRTHFKEMERLFEEKPSIDLIDLFDLEISIRKPGDEERKKIGSIDDSGSEGTITAIKSHLMMILISDLLGRTRARLPIFLDETGTLGSSNYKQILDMAKEMDIQIMTASPNAVEFAERQHPIVGFGPKNRLRIKPKQFWGPILSEE